MENFIVKNQPKFGDANYESLRSDKTKIPPATKKDYEIVAFHIAVKMMECFCFRPWMTLPNVMNAKGERINHDGEIYTPKFRRK